MEIPKVPLQVPTVAVPAMVCPNNCNVSSTSPASTLSPRMLVSVCSYLVTHAAHSRQQPLKEMNSPKAEGNVGVKGAKANDFEVSNPAAAAALTSANGVSA
jgi:hypothetical protein